MCDPLPWPPSSSALRSRACVCALPPPPSSPRRFRLSPRPLRALCVVGLLVPPSCRLSWRMCSAPRGCWEPRALLCTPLTKETSPRDLMPFPHAGGGTESPLLVQPFTRAAPHQPIPLLPRPPKTHPPSTMRHPCLQARGIPSEALTTARMVEGAEPSPSHCPGAAARSHTKCGKPSQGRSAPGMSCAAQAALPRRRWESC